MCVRLQLETVTQQLAVDSTNVPLRITSAEVLGAFGSANHNAAAAVFECQGKLFRTIYGQHAFVIHHHAGMLVLDTGSKETQDHYVCRCLPLCLNNHPMTACGSIHQEFMSGRYRLHANKIINLSEFSMLSCVQHMLVSAQHECHRCRGPAHNSAT